MLTPDDRPAVAELVPVMSRAVDLDPDALVRIRIREQAATVLARLPFDVLVSRSVTSAPRDTDLDLTAAAADVLAWAESAAAPEPVARDLEWRAGLPPQSGWHRIETVPDEVIRNIVRTGALAIKDAAAREGLPGSQPSAAVTDALLDSIVLTATDDTGATAELTLRAVSALTRMGFLPRGGHAYVDICGRWARLVGEYGTVYLERPGQGLAMA